MCARKEDIFRRVPTCRLKSRISHTPYTLTLGARLQLFQNMYPSAEQLPGEREIPIADKHFPRFIRFTSTSPSLAENKPYHAYLNFPANLLHCPKFAGTSPCNARSNGGHQTCSQRVLASGRENPTEVCPRCGESSRGWQFRRREREKAAGKLKHDRRYNVITPG